MSERRSVLILCIGLTLCLSIWRISQQDTSIQTDYTLYEPLEVYANGEEISHSKNNDSKIASSVRTTIVTSTHYDQPTKNDANTLIDLDNFEYLIEKSACDDNSNNSNSNVESPIVLILIHSAPGNWQKRNVIRETWGQHDARARRYFLLGAVNSTSLQSQLNQENHVFNDIIQGNFMDAYRNMTYKHIMALKWFVYNCSKWKYLLKTDDDVFVNAPAVYDFLQMNATHQTTNYLFCIKTAGARVKRSYRSKWRVSTKEFPGRYYPPYCPGFSILYSRDVVFRLYREAQQLPYFWIDDVHVTGTLAQHINLNITEVGKYYMNSDKRDNIFNGRMHLNEIEPMFLFTEPDLIEDQIRQLWTVTSEFNKR